MTPSAAVLRQRMPTSVSSDRYRIGIRTRPARVRIHDRRSAATLFDWRGAAARHLIDSGALPERYRLSGEYGCDKPLVMHLALAVTSMNIALPRPHAWIAGILNAHPGRHLSADDVVWLALLDSPNVDPAEVRRSVDDLVRWKRISRIVVDDDHVFYDVVTEPHLHVFDATTGELRDAPADGVVTIG